MNYSRREFLGHLGKGIFALSMGSSLELLAEGTVSAKNSNHGKTGLDLTTPFIWKPEYSFKWMDSFPYSFLKGRHVSPVEKYELLHQQLMLDQFIGEEKKGQMSQLLTDDDFRLVHTNDYLRRLELLSASYFGLFNGENVIIPRVLDFAKASCEGTYQAGLVALNRGKAMNLSGGFHHAFADHEEGFCHLNDVAIAIRKLQREKKIEKAMIVDCDVHHGNGNASIFLNDPSVFTFDIYQSDNYPSRKIKTDVAIALDSSEGIDDVRYMTELKGKFEKAMDTFKPDIVFYLDGSDPLKNDRLGGFLLTHEGLEQRDAYVLKTASERKIPVAVVLAGGYARNIEDTVLAHYNCANLI